MKGGIAAMMMALKAVKECGIELKGDVMVGTVVDEETGGMGTVSMVDRGYRADGCIITEPTNMTIAPLCRGILWGKITIEGRSGHIELPLEDWRQGGAVDSIEKMRGLLDAFDRLNKEWARTRNHPLLKVPCQIIVGQMIAGEYPSAYANKAEISFDVQFLPEHADIYGGGGNLKKEVEDFVALYAQSDPYLKEHPPIVEWILNADCAETPADHPFVKTMQSSVEKTGEEPVLEGAYCHTDMGWLVRAGIPTVNFGPGNPRVAHQNDEYVPLNEVMLTAKAIAVAIMDWCEIG